MAEKISNYIVMRNTWLKTKIVTIDNKKVKVPVEYEKRMMGIYPSNDEAEFILRKAQKNDFHDRLEKMNNLNLKGSQIPKSYFSIKETDNPVTTGRVADYISSDIYKYSLTKKQNGG